jgi:hypothetical protein
MSLLDFILEIGDLYLSWRFWVGFTITTSLCCLAFLAIPEGITQWVVCVPLTVVGVVLSLRWQRHADLHE